MQTKGSGNNVRAGMTPEQMEKGERDAMLDNECKMQSGFFELRARFFAIYIEKFPTEPAEENFKMAHYAAKLDYTARYTESEKLLSMAGVTMRQPMLNKLLQGDA